VAETELARLGERHFRGQTGCARRQEGQGLGLHIARTVAERHGFTLRFGRPEGGGLEVQITGPLADGPQS